MKRKAAHIAPLHERCKKPQEVESHRMTHIAMERNQQCLMNEHLASLRSLIPSGYIYHPTATDASISTNSPRHLMAKILKSLLGCWFGRLLVWSVVGLFQFVCLSCMMLSYACLIYFSSAA